MEINGINKSLVKVILILFFFINEMTSRFTSDNLKNVLGTELVSCKDGTGFYRNGFCHTGENDHGTHVVCAIVTEKFLTFTKSQGNDLSTQTSYFPGLKPGDHWCLCGYRFEQARKAGFAPNVILNASHIRTLEFTPLEELKKYEKSK